MDRKRLGRRIKAYRKLKGYTQVELAKKLGLPIITIGNVERGSQDASEELLDLIVDTLDIPKKELLLLEPVKKEE